MRTFYSLIAAITLVACAACAASKPVEDEQTAPQAGRIAQDNLIVGMEYVVLDNEKFISASAKAFAETGMTGMKLYPEAVRWDKMQTSPQAKIDFRKLDQFVYHYQKQGFSELTIALKTWSRWGSKDVGWFGANNASPKAEYLPQFKNWVKQIVERYDGDGEQDMPGLRWPLHYYEIGVEFSSFQPEPVEDYLQTLKVAYQAAHAADKNVMIGHAAFLVTPVNMDVKTPADYETIWRETERHDQHHDLADMRKILDRPQWFDVINLHNLGDPYEIEDLQRWLHYEMQLRHYHKPVIISDTTPTSYIGWGSATRCSGKKLGIVVRPAKPADRCRLAEFFSALTHDDPVALNWARGFIAIDHVQRTVIAAEQKIRLINLAFIGDIPLMTTRISQAGAGLSAWAGALDANVGRGEINQNYPAYYAVKQLMEKFYQYEDLQRLHYPDKRVRVYRWRQAGRWVWLAWYDPQMALTPSDQVPKKTVSIDVPLKKVTVEPVIVEMGQTQAKKESSPINNGKIEVQLSHHPIYLFGD